MQHIGGQEQLPTEYLLPRIHQDVHRAWPSFVAAHRDSGSSTEQLSAEVERLGPWTIPYPLTDEVNTMERGRVAAVAEHRMLFRRDLIGKTVVEVLGENASRASVLDLGCNSGFFSMDLVDRGVGEVHGVDLRAKNIEQAKFLAHHYGVDRVNFQTLDVDDVDSDAQWDVVLNLGVLYHMVNPLQLIRQTYDLCRHFAIIDSACHREPVSGYIMMGNKNVDLSEEGRETYELRPTYRGAIDTIQYAGFRDVFEIVGEAEDPHGVYRAGRRRCFLAVK